MAIYIAIALVLAGLALGILLKPASSAGSRAIGASLSCDDFTLRSQGWSSAELAKILSDFAVMYELPADTFRAAKLESGAFEIEAVQPITSDELLYLINYLNYPKGFDLTDRQLTVAAKITPSEAMWAPSELTGRQATVYVPSGDTEFDVLYASVEPASYFRIPFTNLRWVPADAPREPQGVAQLMDERDR